MNIVKEQNNDRGRLVLKGELTLEYIRPLYEELKGFLENVQHLDVDVSEAVETDLSFLQLLCSVHRTAMKKGKTITLAKTIPDVFLQAMDDNGCRRQSSCSLDINKTCLWAIR